MKTDTAQAARWLRWATLACYTGLLLNLFYGVAVYGPVEIAAQLVLWLFFASGLLLVLWGLFKGRKRSYIWLCFILLLYFIAAVQSLFAVNPQTGQLRDTYEVIRLLLIVVGFIVSMLASRGARVT